MTVPAGYQTMPKCFDDRGFQITCGVTSVPAAVTTAAAVATSAVTAKQASQVNADIAASSTTASASHQNSAARFELAMPIMCAVAMALAALLY